MCNICTIIRHTVYVLFLQHINLISSISCSGVGNAYLSGASEFNQVFSEVRVTQSLVLCVVFRRSLYVVFLLAIFVFSALLLFTASD